MWLELVDPMVPICAASALIWEGHEDLDKCELGKEKDSTEEYKNITFTYTCIDVRLCVGEAFATDLTCAKNSIEGLTENNRANKFKIKKINQTQKTEIP